MFLIGLSIPALSVVSLVLTEETGERQPLDWRILGGGIAFGAVVLALALGRVPFAQELIFLVSMTVICVMLVWVTRDLDHHSRMAIFYTSIIIFAFRATPAVGDGYFWWTLDVLKFDESFYGHLRQTGALISIVVMWVFAKQLTEYSVKWTLFWLAILGTLLSLPSVGLYYGLHEWTEAQFGFGARTIAFIDAATSSPFAQLSMIPLLTLIAYYAPAGRRATWFALMASLMNMALVAGQLQTKYLNQAFTVGRGEYAELGILLVVVTALGLFLSRSRRSGCSAAASSDQRDRSSVERTAAAGADRLHEAIADERRVTHGLAGRGLVVDPGADQARPAVLERRVSNCSNCASSRAPTLFSRPAPRAIVTMSAWSRRVGGRR